MSKQQASSFFKESAARAKGSLNVSTLALALASLPLSAIWLRQFGLAWFYVLAVIGLGAWLWRQGYLSLPNNRLIAGAGLLLGWGLLSCLWSPSRLNSLAWTVLLLVSYLFFILAMQLKPEWWMRAFAIINGAFGFWAVVSRLQHVGRFGGTFFWPNPAAVFLAVGVIISLALFLHGQRFFLISLGFSFVGLILTGSKIALIALLAVLGIRFLRARQTKTLYLVAALILIAALGWSLVRPAGQKAARVSLRDRTRYAREALDVWRAHPVIGLGAGTYPLIALRETAGEINPSVSVHNFYLQSLAELGLVGGLMLLGLVIFLMRPLWSAFASEAWALPAAALMLALHFGLEVDNLYPLLWVLLAILLGFSYRAGVPEKH